MGVLDHVLVIEAADGEVVDDQAAVAADGDVVLVGDLVRQRGAEERHASPAALATSMTVEPHAPLRRRGKLADALVVPVVAVIEVVGIEQFQVLVLDRHGVLPSLGCVALSMEGRGTPPVKVISPGNRSSLAPRVIAGIPVSRKDGPSPGLTLPTASGSPRRAGELLGSHPDCNAEQHRACG